MTLQKTFRDKIGKWWCSMPSQLFLLSFISDPRNCKDTLLSFKAIGDARKVVLREISSTFSFTSPYPIEILSSSNLAKLAVRGDRLGSWWTLRNQRGGLIGPLGYFSRPLLSGKLCSHFWPFGFLALRLWLTITARDCSHLVRTSSALVILAMYLLIKSSSFLPLGFGATCKMSDLALCT